jgi:hypothetical protein
MVDLVFDREVRRDGDAILLPRVAERGNGVTENIVNQTARTLNVDAGKS